MRSHLNHSHPWVEKGWEWHGGAGSGGGQIVIEIIAATIPTGDYWTATD